LEISICMYDKVRNKLFYSGAGSRVFIYDNTGLKNIRGNYGGISGSTQSDLIFDVHEFNVETGLIIYMLSDGITDQFGGEKGKKFLSSRLEKAILSCVKESMKNQEIFFKKMIRDWMGEWKQIDDILFFGVAF
jgi:serine phosphatase RsbU (regulator of sigma subunit)